jgi:predicted outer membrane repeat protein
MIGNVFDTITCSGMGCMVVKNSESFVMSGCTFTNIVTTFLIVSYSRNISLIDKCAFSDRTVGLSGLVWLPKAGSMIISNSRFSNVNVRRRGAIVVEEDSGVFLLNSSFNYIFENLVFVGGASSQVFMHNTTLSNGFGSCNGGSCGKVEANGVVRIQNSMFRNCLSPNGGAIYASEGSQLIINSSSFFNNSALHSGGALYASRYSFIWINGSTS